MGMEQVRKGLMWKPEGIFSATTLKYIAMICMLIDHTAACLLPGGLLYRIMRHIGRFSFPVFAFFLAEGYCHTRSKPKYMIRLLVFALISQIPYESAVIPAQLRRTGFYGDVYWTLAMGLAAIWIWDTLIQKQVLKWKESGKPITCIPFLLGCCFTAVTIIAVLCLIANRFHTDYAEIGIVTILLFYLLRKYPLAAGSAAYAALSIYNHSEVWALPAFVMLLLYNGQRGRQNKYFFYGFYPVHLAVLWGIKMCM